MSHGTEQHKEHKSGAGSCKGHAPETDYETGKDHCAKSHEKHEHRREEYKEHCQEDNSNGSSHDEVVAENIAMLTDTVSSLGATIELLVQKAASMAYHIIATEEIVSELVAKSGLDLAQVNARIRAKIAVGTDNQGDSNTAVDLAASIASLVPRR